MKKNLKSIAMAVVAFGAMFQTTQAQWSTNGNNATGASADTPNEFVGTLNNFNLNFKTNTVSSSAVKMTLTTTGRVGIATTAPIDKLDVNGNINTSGTFKVTNMQVITASKTTKTMRVGGSLLNVGVGTSLPVTKFHVSGGTDAQILTGGFFTIGDTTGQNVAYDNNEILARNNGANSPLILNKTGGFVGIGTVAPTAQLEVVNNNRASLSVRSVNGSSGVIMQRASQDSAVTTQYVTASGGVATWQTGVDIGSPDFTFKNGGSTYVTILRSNGNLGVGTLNPTQRFTVDNGTSIGTYTTSGWIHTSDMRLKTNVVSVSDALSKVMDLNGVYFNWKKTPDTDHQIGFLAQEVEKVLPEVVVKDAAGNYGLAYGSITALLVNAMKEQQQQLVEKDKKMEELVNEIAAIKNRLNQIDHAGASQQQKTSAIKQDENKLPELEQNIPNPSAEKTTIQYYVPSSALNAFVKIYSETGSEIKSIPVTSRGSGSLEISLKSMASGNYSYVLVIDNNVADKKQLTVSK
jgi:hypothetical protein